jgi:HEAT repeat protein
MVADWANRRMARLVVAVCCAVFLTGCGSDTPPPQYRTISVPAEASADVRAAIERLNSPEPLTRAHGAFLLGEMPEPGDQITGWLLEALQDGNHLVRSRAAEALGKVGSEAAIAPLIAIMKQPQEDRDVLAQTAEALGCLRAAEAVEPLTLALDDIVWRVRYQSVIALGRIADPIAKTALADAVRYDPDFRVREAAQTALQQLPEDQQTEIIGGDAD